MNIELRDYLAATASEKDIARYIQDPNKGAWVQTTQEQRDLHIQYGHQTELGNRYWQPHTYTIEEARYRYADVMLQVREQSK